MAPVPSISEQKPRPVSLSLPRSVPAALKRRMRLSTPKPSHVSAPPSIVSARMLLPAGTLMAKTSKSPATWWPPNMYVSETGSASEVARVSFASDSLPLLVCTFTSSL